ncbi:MAG: hypothetical protein U0804_12720 [Gemmataceae bacterium]
MGIHQDNDGSMLAAVNAAPRALVFLTVPWSGPERSARAQFRAAAHRLAAEHPELGIEFFSLDEEADWCQAWVGAFGIEGLGYGVPRGAGSMLWLERGRLVSSELGGAGLAAGGIVARTLWLWARPTPPDGCPSPSS